MTQGDYFTALVVVKMNLNVEISALEIVLGELTWPMTIGYKRKLKRLKKKLQAVDETIDFIIKVAENE